MKNRRATKTIGVALAAGALLVGLGVAGCSSSTFSGQSSPNQVNNANTSNAAGKTQQNNSSSQQKSNSSYTTPDQVVPPVVVLGSYLTGVLNDDRGSLVSDAELKVVKSNYSTKTDSKGMFSIPISKIPSDELFRISLRKNNRFEEFETNLPSDIRFQINQALENPNPPAQLPRQLGLVVGHSFFTASETSTASKAVETLISNSLPLPTSQIRVSNLTNILAYSEGKFARLSWNAQIASPATAEVRLAYGKSEQGLLAWDGSNDNVLLGHGGYIRGVAGCTDDTGFNVGSGEFQVTGQEKCGINLDLPPFAPGVDFYFRVMAKSESEWKVSQVFKARSTTQVSRSWMLFTPEKELCEENYRGPVLTADSYKTALQQQPPECNEQNLFKVWCGSEADSSASKCKDCEENLLICK